MIVTVVVRLIAIHKQFLQYLQIHRGNNLNQVGIIPLMIALIMSSITFQTKGHGMMMMNEILLKKI